MAECLTPIMLKPGNASSVEHSVLVLVMFTSNLDGLSFNILVHTKAVLTKLELLTCWLPNALTLEASSEVALRHHTTPVGSSLHSS